MRWGTRGGYTGNVNPKDYLRALYHPGDHVALVLLPRGEDAAKRRTEQRVWTAERLASEKVQGWLRHMNAQRYDVFVGQNPMTGVHRAAPSGGPARLRRQKEDVLRVDRVYLDIDERGDARLQRILAEADRGDVPRPRFAVATSPDRVQVIWQLPPGALPKDRAEALMRGLAAEYGADRAATDVSRVLRLPGYRNHKRDGFYVTVAHQAETVARPEGFPERLYELRPGPQAARARGVPATGGRDTSRSGQDWRMVQDQLRQGKEPADIEQALARDRQDKREPLAYARRTVANALASLERTGPRRPQQAFER